MPTPVSGAGTTTAATAGVTSTSSSSSAASSASGVGSGSYSSLSDLKAQAPQVYQAMMVGIAQQICNDMQQQQQELAQMMDEYRSENS